MGRFFVIPAILTRSFSKICHYIFYTRNEALQVVFGTLVVLGHLVLIIDMLPVLTRFEPEDNHSFLPITFLFTNLAFYELSCLSDPGRISKRNVDAFLKVYKYDGMYTANVQCSTCGFIKPARSKHCSLCNRCVHRFDHHCVWTNSCIGVFNLRYFLLFLLSLVVMCANGVLVTTHCLLLLVTNLKLMEASYEDAVTGQAHPITYVMLVQHLFFQVPRIVVLLGSLVVVLLLLVPFLLFHLYLVAINRTTNEYVKLDTAQQQLTRNSNNNADDVKKALARSSTFYNRGLLRNFREVLFPQVPQVRTDTLASAEKHEPSQQNSHSLKSGEKRE